MFTRPGSVSSKPSKNRAMSSNDRGMTWAEALAAALQMLPDVLRYDRARAAGYPNGQTLTDDVYSMRFAWLSDGQIPPSGLKPHDDLLASFPYAGPPHP